MLKSTSSMECFMLKSTSNLGETLLMIYAEVYINFRRSVLSSLWEVYHSSFRLHLSNKTSNPIEFTAMRATFHSISHFCNV